MGKGWLGKDGQFYETWDEARGADNRYIQQEMQSKLLFEQNQLMIKQLEEEEKRHKQEKEIEQERIKHEKEMRILKLFDDVSIPFNVYQSFENYLLSIKNEDLDEEGIEVRTAFFGLASEKMNLITQHREEFENIKKTVYSNDDTAINNKKVKYNEKYKIFEDFVNDKIKIDDLSTEKWNIFDNDNQIQTLLNQLKKQNDIKKKAISKCKDQNTKKFIIGIFITLLIVSIWANMTIFFMFCLAIVLLSFYFSKKIRIYELKKQLNKSINLKILEEGQLNVAREKELSKLDEDIENISKALKPIEKTVLNQKIDLFNKFRFSHYNMKMEKLFVDVGLIEKCKEKDVQFDIIDKNKISAEGTFEDYFNFFQNFENIYSDTSDN